MSAIPEMTVAEIRRALSKLREIWAETTPESPLFICDKLHNDKSIADFAKEFVFGHHLKRHYKSVTQTNLTVARKRAGAAAIAAAAAAAGGGLLSSVHSSTEKTAVPGPKGDVNDPFPFASTWAPKTSRGKRAFAAANTRIDETEGTKTTAASASKKK